MIVIPGGCTPYLQAGDIGIFRELKDNLSEIIEAWKNSDNVIYTRGGNPKPPPYSVVESWLRDSWKAVSVSNIQNSIKSAGFAGDAKEWHIAKHDVYGAKFLKAWMNCQDNEVALAELEICCQLDNIAIDDDN